jgi:predicted RNA binding protein with dsRBD fold (UPF0201 family)
MQAAVTNKAPTTTAPPDCLASKDLTVASKTSASLSLSCTCPTGSNCAGLVLSGATLTLTSNIKGVTTAVAVTFASSQAPTQSTSMTNKQVVAATTSTNKARNVAFTFASSTGLAFLSQFSTSFANLLVPPTPGQPAPAAAAEIDIISDTSKLTPRAILFKINSQLTIGTVFSRIGVTWPLAPDFISVNGFTLLYSGSTFSLPSPPTAFAAYFPKTGSANTPTISKQLTLAGLFDIPVLKLSKANVMLMLGTCGPAAVGVNNAMRTDLQIQVMTSWNLINGLQLSNPVLAIGGTNDVSGMVDGMFFTVPFTVALGVTGKNITFQATAPPASQQGKAVVNVGNFVTALFASPDAIVKVNIPSFLLDFLKGISFTTVSVGYMTGSGFTFSAVPNINGNPALAKVLQVLGLPANSVMLSVGQASSPSAASAVQAQSAVSDNTAIIETQSVGRHRRSLQSVTAHQHVERELLAQNLQLQLSIMKTFTFSPGSPFDGPSILSFSLALTAGATPSLALMANFEAALNLRNAQPPTPGRQPGTLTFSLGGSVIIADPVLLGIKGFTSNAYTLSDFPYITINAFYIDCLADPATETLRRLNLISDVSILGGNALTIIIFDASAAPPVFGMLNAISNIDLQMILTSVGINTNLGALNIHVTQIAQSFSPTAMSITIPAATAITSAKNIDPTPLLNFVGAGGAKVYPIPAGLHWEADVSIFTVLNVRGLFDLSPDGLELNLHYDANLEDLAASVLSELGNVVMQLGNQLLSEISNNLHLKQVADAAVAEFQTAETAAENAFNAVKNAAEAAVTAAQNAFNSAVSALTSLANTIQQGIIDAANQVANGITGVANDVGNFFGGLFGRRRLLQDVTGDPRYQAQQQVVNAAQANLNQANANLANINNTPEAQSLAAAQQQLAQGIINQQSAANNLAASNARMQTAAGLAGVIARTMLQTRITPPASKAAVSGHAPRPPPPLYQFSPATTAALKVAAAGKTDGKTPLFGGVNLPAAFKTEIVSKIQVRHAEQRAATAASPTVTLPPPLKLQPDVPRAFLGELFDLNSIDLGLVLRLSKQIAFNGGISFTAAGQTVQGSFSFQVSDDLPTLAMRLVNIVWGQIKGEFTNIANDITTGIGGFFG